MTVPDGSHALSSFTFSTAFGALSFLIFTAGPLTEGSINNELPSQVISCQVISNKI